MFSEDVFEILEYIPANLKVIRHVRPKYSCDKCNHVVEAPAPSRTIVRGLAGPGLIAHVLISKYADHCPLYRQSEVYAREDIELDRSTMADWVGAASQLLTPFVDALRKHVLATDKIHVDDTPVPVCTRPWQNENWRPVDLSAKRTHGNQSEMDNSGLK
jgi:transposase